MRHIERRLCFARRLRRDRQADLVVGAEIGIAVFETPIEHARAVPRSRRAQPGPVQRLGDPRTLDGERGDQAARVEIADRQAASAAVGQRAPLQDETLGQPASPAALRRGSKAPAPAGRRDRRSPRAGLSPPARRAAPGRAAIAVTCRSRRYCSGSAIGSLALKRPVPPRNRRSGAANRDRRSA